MQQLTEHSKELEGGSLLVARQVFNVLFGLLKEDEEEKEKNT